MHLESLHKHDIKGKVGWAPIKENIVAGSLLESGVLFNKKEVLNIWDPFCGCGTIGMEIISYLFEDKIRN